MTRPAASILPAIKTKVQVSITTTESKPQSSARLTENLITE